MKLLELLLEEKIAELWDRQAEYMDDRVWFVTELVQCPMKHLLRSRYPSLMISNVLNTRLLIGELLHIGLQIISIQKFKELDASIEREVEKKITINGNEYVIRGKADLIINDIVYEIKTINCIKDDLPLPHHVDQLKIYMNMLDFIEGRLIYISLYDNRILEYYIIKSDIDVETKLKDQLRRLRENDYPLYDWECQYCIFKQVCPRVIRNDNKGGRGKS